MKEIKLFNGWMCDNIEPCDWSNWRRYKNYFCKVTMSKEGNEIKEFLDSSKDSDLYFNVSSAKKNNILLASCWDSRKNRQYKHYYIVNDITNETISLIDRTDDVNFTTYLKTYKALQKM